MKWEYKLVLTERELVEFLNDNKIEDFKIIFSNDDWVEIVFKRPVEEKGKDIGRPVEEKEKIDNSYKSWMRCANCNHLIKPPIVFHSC